MSDSVDYIEVPQTEAPRVIEAIEGEVLPPKRKPGRPKGTTGSLPHLKHIKNSTPLKKEFVKNIIATGGELKRAYKKTFPKASIQTANRNGSIMFRDPEVQEIWAKTGVTVEYLASKAKDLMDMGQESTQKDLVKHFTKPLLKEEHIQRTERVSMTLFGELTDGHMQLIQSGRKIELDGRSRKRAETREAEAAEPGAGTAAS